MSRNNGGKPKPAGTEQRRPLVWPSGWVRTDPSKRVDGRFRGHTERVGHEGTTWKDRRAPTWAEATARVEAALARFGADPGLIVSSDGAGGRAARGWGGARSADPGVAIYFSLTDVKRVMACDRFTEAVMNLAAIAAHIEAIRAVERYGVGSLERIFVGYNQLPARPSETTGDCWAVLGLAREQEDRPGLPTVAEVEQAFKARAKVYHPDVGGTTDDMQRLIRAREAALLQAAP